MKRLIALLLLIVMLLCACGNEGDSKNERAEAEASVSTTEKMTQAPTAQLEEIAPTTEATDDTQITEPSETESTPEISEEDILVGEFMADESGFWAGYRFVGNKSSEVIFDNKKQVCYTNADAEDRLIYGNGMFISTENDVQYLKDAYGTVICSTESLDITGFGMTRNTQKNVNFLSDGYVLAYKITESLSTVTFEIGFLDCDGNWLVELSDQNPLVDCGFHCDADSLKEDLVYVGEGCLMVPVSEKDYDPAYRLYNLNTQEIYDIVRNGSGSNLDYMCSKAKLVNGVCYDNYNANMYEIHADGTVNCYRFVPEEFNSDDIYGYIVKDGGIYSLVHDDDITSIVTAEGIIASVSGFDLIDCVPMDDYFMISAENENDTVYFAAIDLEGNFLFEPVQTDAATILLTNGTELSTNDDVGQPTGTKIVIDENGQIVYESQNQSTEIAVQNGIVREANDLDRMENEDIYTRLP